MSILKYSPIIILISYFFTSFLVKTSINLDYPNSRSSHIRPTPSSCGLAFISTTLIFIIIDILLNKISYANSIFLLCLPIALVGFVDDKLDLNKKIRYLVLLIVVVSLIFANLNSNQSLVYELSNFRFLFPIIFTLLIFLGTGLINLINFMDGIDGLVAGCFVISTFFIGLNQNHLIFYLSAALIGFLISNWYPAKIFMGDVGSTFLGSVLVANLFQSENIIDFLNIGLLNLPLIADAFICLSVRCVKGENIFLPHKKHLYQRLTENGWSHSKVSLIYLISTLILGLSVTLGNIIITVILSFVILILGLTLNNNHAAKFI